MRATRGVSELTRSMRGDAAVTIESCAIIVMMMPMLKRHAKGTGGTHVFKRTPVLFFGS